MANPLLSSAQYPAIRAAIDVKLAATDLPDAVIALDIYKGAAIQDVLARDPSAESRTGDAEVHVTSAGIYFCAARLCPAVVRVTSLSVSTRDLNYSRQTFDPEQRAAELRALADTELARVLEPSEDTPSRPTMFTIAAGTRGK